MRRRCPTLPVSARGTAATIGRLLELSPAHRMTSSRAAYSSSLSPSSSRKIQSHPLSNPFTGEKNASISRSHLPPPPDPLRHPPPLPRRSAIFPPTTKLQRRSHPPCRPLVRAATCSVTSATMIHSVGIQRTGICVPGPSSSMPQPLIDPYNTAAATCASVKKATMYTYTLPTNGYMI